MKLSITFFAFFAFIYAAQAFDYKIGLTVSSDFGKVLDGKVSGVLLGKTFNQKFEFNQTAFGKSERLIADVSLPEEVELVVVKWNSALSSSLKLKPFVVSWDRYSAERHFDVFLPKEESILNGTMTFFYKA